MIRHALMTTVSLVTAVCATAGALAQSAPAPAAPAASATGEALGSCMVEKTTGADRIRVAQWMVAALASAPQVAGVAKVDAARRDESDKQMAAIFTRLLTKDCAALARTAFAEKNNAMGIAGQALGRIAVAELLSNPQASQALEAYTKYLNQDDFKAVTQ